MLAFCSSCFSPSPSSFEIRATSTKALHLTLICDVDFGSCICFCLDEGHEKAAEESNLERSEAIDMPDDSSPAASASDVLSEEGSSPSTDDKSGR